MRETDSDLLTPPEGQMHQSVKMMLLSHTLTTGGSHVVSLIKFRPVVLGGKIA